jgi:putative hemolysin
LAGTLFILLPFLGFYLGYKYHELSASNCELNEISLHPTINSQNESLNPTISPSFAGMANPASVNCNHKGGTLTILKRGDDGEYGLCEFNDGRACEEWAMFRGECPIGGVKTTGLDTIEQKYCAWVGGETSTINPNCMFKGGSYCGNQDLYNGTCQRDQSKVIILFPKGGETLVKGKQYTLKWTGGQNELTINLIAKDLEKIGYSASLLDRLDHIPNTGTYEYIVPDRLPDGTYQFSIGGSITDYFQIISPI